MYASTVAPDWMGSVTTFMLVLKSSTVFVSAAMSLTPAPVLLMASISGLSFG